MLQTSCSQPELRAALCKRAAHYCPSTSDQSLLIDRTISAVCADPELVDSDEIHDALFKVMHRLAQRTLASDLANDRVFATA